MRSIPLVLLLVLAGCGDPLSNRLFEEDALFAAALPTARDLATEHPESAQEGARGIGDEALLPPQARGVALQANGAVAGFLGAVLDTLDTPVSERSDDRRVWGPVERDEGQIRLVVTRASDGAFDYAVEVEVGAGWEVMAEGSFSAGEVEGDGEAAFVLRGDRLAALLGRVGGGLLEVEHLREGRATVLRATRTAWTLGEGPPRDVDIYFERPAIGGGVFEHRVEVDLGEGASLEVLATRARWGPGGRGRSDFAARGGDLPVPVAGTECWDEELLRTFWRLELPGGPEEEGVETDCGFSREDPRELPDEE